MYNALIYYYIYFTAWETDGLQCSVRLQTNLRNNAIAHILELNKKMMYFYYIIYKFPTPCIIYHGLFSQMMRFKTIWLTFCGCRMLTVKAAESEVLLVLPLALIWWAGISLSSWSYRLDPSSSTTSTVGGGRSGNARLVDGDLSLIIDCLKQTRLGF